jgi:chitodextrinase
MKLVMGSCATLLAFALITPAATAGPRPPRDTTPPSVPTGLRVVSVTEDSVTLAWNASTDNSGSIHHYVVSPGSWHPGDSTTKTVTGLVPNYTQTYRVSAVDAAGNDSGQSAPLTATTARDVTAPTTPGNLRLTATISPSSITLAWDRSTDRWSFSYEILRNGELFASASSTSTRLRHIPRNSTSTWTVRARDNSGNVSAVSNAIVVAQPPSDDGTAPTVPANLTATSLEDFCGSVQLNWGQSIDDVDAPSAIEYELYRNGVFFDLVTGTGSTFVYAGPGTSTWFVVAVDRSGNSSAPSNTASVTTNADENLC